MLGTLHENLSTFIVAGEIKSL